MFKLCIVNDNNTSDNSSALICGHASWNENGQIAHTANCSDVCRYLQFNLSVSCIYIQCFTTFHDNLLHSKRHRIKLLANLLQTSSFDKSTFWPLICPPPPPLEVVANLFFCVVEIFTKASLGVIIVKSMHEMFYILISQNLFGNRVKVRLILFYS